MMRSLFLTFAVSASSDKFLDKTNSKLGHPVLGQCAGICEDGKKEILVEGGHCKCPEDESNSKPGHPTLGSCTGTCEDGKNKMLVEGGECVCAGDNSSSNPGHPILGQCAGKCGDGKNPILVAGGQCKCPEDHTGLLGQCDCEHGLKGILTSTGCNCEHEHLAPVSPHSTLAHTEPIKELSFKLDPTHGKVSPPTTPPPHEGDPAMGAKAAMTLTAILGAIAMLSLSVYFILVSMGYITSKISDQC